MHPFVAGILLLTLCLTCAAFGQKPGSASCGSGMAGVGGGTFRKTMNLFTDRDSALLTASLRQSNTPWVSQYGKEIGEAVYAVHADNEAITAEKLETIVADIVCRSAGIPRTSSTIKDVAKRTEKWVREQRWM